MRGNDKMIPMVNQDIQIQSYKHNQFLHRIWEKATVLFSDDKVTIVANRRTKVIEANGRFWHTREPSVTWFFKDKWYNIIGIIKKDGVAYYCNIASPYLVDDEALKYIDYDLDVKVLCDLSFTILDRNEYNKHQVKMGYSDKLKKILEKELLELIEMIKNTEGPFNSEVVMNWYEKYSNGGSK